MRRVVLYSRPGCHLCDVARAVIDGVARRVSFEFAEVDISGDDRLELAYGIRIPVIEIDGEERFEIAVDGDAFERAVLP